jgi:hypothetical protein
MLAHVYTLAHTHKPDPETERERERERERESRACVKLMMVLYILWQE